MLLKLQNLAESRAPCTRQAAHRALGWPHPSALGPGFEVVRGPLERTVLASGMGWDGRASHGELVRRTGTAGRAGREDIRAADSMEPGRP